MAKRGREEEIESELQQENISVILKSYEDIFSSFDPRPFSGRGLSDDFLEECKKAVMDKKENGDKFVLRLLMPPGKRSTSREKEILLRLKEHFHKHFVIEKKKEAKVRGEGIIWFIFGAVFLVIATFLSGGTSFIMRLLEIMSVPAGWFLFWEGLDKVFITSKSNARDFEFYKRMKDSSIKFFGY